MPAPAVILAELHPRLRLAVEKICEQVPVVPFCGYRSLDEQAALYAKGRTAPGSKVTNAKPGQSAHNFNPPAVGDGALACDLILDVNRVKVRRTEWKGRLYPDAWDDASVSARPIWIALGVAAREQGLVWGGDWKGFVDKPHVELPDWRSLVRADLRARITK